MHLGWLETSFAVADVQRTSAWYEALGFQLVETNDEGKTRTLARPEIVTVENNKATISLGEEIPYATVSSAGTSGFAAAGAASTSEVLTATDKELIII